MEDPFHIAIIGPGKAGRFLTQAFRQKGINTDVYARRPDEGEFYLRDFPGPNSYTLTLICVPDNHIEKVSHSLPVSEGIIAHVSGATPLSVINRKHPRRAVFYPVMSFSEDMDIRKVPALPVCLESNFEHDLDILKKLVTSMHWKAYELGSEQRQHLHLAAVWAHNFSNHLYQIAYEELQRAGLDMHILKPLLTQAVDKLGSGAPFTLQTGPALRGDDQTIASHLGMIEDANLRDIYKKLTQSIQNKK